MPNRCPGLQMPFPQCKILGNAEGRSRWRTCSEQLGPQHTAKRRRVRGPVLAASDGRERFDVDIAIIGGGQPVPSHLHVCAHAGQGYRCAWTRAGVIGLATTFSLLQKTQNKKLSIALIESNDSIPAPAIGSGAATGAGERLTCGVTVFLVCIDR